MRYAVDNLRNVKRILIVVLAVGVWWYAPVARAEQTTVVTTICSAASSQFTIDTPANDSIVVDGSVTITGTVRRISQLQVYRNGLYESVNPIDAGSTSYTVSVPLSVGDNAITLKGIDPCTANTYESSLLIHYVPGATPTPQPQEPNPIVAVVKDAHDSAQVTTQYFDEQVRQAANTRPFTVLSDTLYRAMVAIDLAPKTATAADVHTMVTRAFLVTAGVSLLMLAHPMVTLYHFMRYQVLKWNIHALPELVRHHAVFTLRIVGTILLLLPFLFLM